MEKLIEIKNLSKKFTKSKNFLGKSSGFVYALNKVNLDIYKGEILGIVGESGCGKSTLGRCVLNLITPDTGEIIYKKTDLLTIDDKSLKKTRKSLQMIFQNPYSSLNPRMKIKDILKEPLKINTKLNTKEIDAKIDKILAAVGLSPDIKNNFPHEFSGGQRQRIVIAKALILEPEFVIADEPISALDISIQAQIIKLLKNLKNELNLTYMFISHDLSTVKYLCDRVAVMYLGEIVEIGQTQEIFGNPKHPYTKILLNSIPKIGSKNDTELEIKGEPPSNENLSSCCQFATRCPYVMNICKEQKTQSIDITDTHNVKCFLIN